MQRACPPGVFNLVQGDGAGVGAALAKHPGIDMVSFTGSTRAGIMVAKNAADTVKRVAQELGGKSPNIILEGRRSTRRCPAASAASCSIPARAASRRRGCSSTVRSMTRPSTMRRRDVRRQVRSATRWTEGDISARWSTRAS